MTAQRANAKIQMCDQTQGPSSGQIQTAPQVRASTNTAYPNAYAKPWRSEASSTSKRGSASFESASGESAVGLGMAENYQIEIPMSHDAARLYTANTNSPFLKKFQRRARNTFCAAIRESSRAIRIDSRTAVRARPLHSSNLHACRRSTRTREESCLLRLRSSTPERFASGSAIRGTL